jgi:GTPase SAR1 family protein
MLVGNKCDETDARELTAKEGEEQARQWSANFMETSAKTNHKVKELFQVGYVVVRFFSNDEFNMMTDSSDFSVIAYTLKCCRWFFLYCCRRGS